METADLQLPLDAYLLSLEEEKRRNLAHRRLLKECLLRFGMRVSIPEPPHDVGVRSPNERRYGLTDGRHAAQIGYGLGDRDPRSRGGDLHPAPSLSPEALAVMTGEGSTLPEDLPEGGCSGEVGRLLEPVDPTSGQALDDTLPQRLSFEAFTASQNDPRVQEAFSDWSACMRARRHAYRTPLEPPADPKFRAPGGPEERRTARDDVACKVETNLVGKWYAVEVAYQDELVEANREALAKLAEAEAVITGA